MFDLVFNRQPSFSLIKIYKNPQFAWYILLEVGWTDSTVITTNTKVASGEKFLIEKQQQNVWGYHMAGLSAIIIKLLCMRSNRD